MANSWYSNSAKNAELGWRRPSMISFYFLSSVSEVIRRLIGVVTKWQFFCKGTSLANSYKFAWPNVYCSVKNSATLEQNHRTCNLTPIHNTTCNLWTTHLSILEVKCKSGVTSPNFTFNNKHIFNFIWGRNWNKMVKSCWSSLLPFVLRLTTINRTRISNPGSS